MNNSYYHELKWIRLLFAVLTLFFIGFSIWSENIAAEKIKNVELSIYGEMEEVFQSEFGIGLNDFDGFINERIDDKWK